MKTSPHVYVNTCINVYMWTLIRIYKIKHHQKIALLMVRHGE